MASKPERRNLLAARADEDITLASVPPARAAAEKIPANQIRTNGSTQMRAAMNPDTVRSYAEAMREGAIFPAIVAYYDGADYWVGDGFHRLAAHREVHGQTAAIAATVHSGSQRDAILHAAGANAEHGLPRSNADKRRAVETLLRDEEWSKWSDREIARRCKVHHSTVAGIRSHMETSGEIRQTEERTVERGGTVYQQAVKTPPAQPADQPTPPPASIAELEAALRRWLPTVFEDEADWLGVLDDIRSRGLAAFPSLRQALPEHSSTVLRIAVDNVWVAVQAQQAAEADDSPSRVVIDEDEPVIIACPACGAEQEDLDGFGVIHCEACGYRVHPSSTGGVCDICGEPDDSQAGQSVEQSTTPRGVQAGQVVRSLHSTLSELDKYSQLTGDFETPVRLRREAEAMLERLGGLMSALIGGD